MPDTVSRRSVLKAAAALSLASWPSAAVLAQSSERLTVRMDKDIQNLDPAERAGAIEGNVIRSVCRNLVAFKRGSFEIENDAAQSIRQIDETVIEFILKPGLTFTGGFGDLTADDVKFSYERFQAAGPDGRKPAYAADWAALDHVEVTGPLAGRIILKQPSAALWTTALADVSGAILSRKAWAKLGKTSSPTLIGAGPYEIAEWTPNQRLVLRLNPTFKGDKPAFQEIVLRPIADPTTGLLAFKAREVQLTRIEANDKKRLEKSADAKLLDLPSINFVWLGINMGKPPFDDPRVRQAIRLGIDVDEVITAGYDGTVQPARALLAPSMLGHWADAPVPKPDAAAAKQLLSEAGKSGLKARLTVLNKPNYVTAAQVIQAQLGEIGMKIELQVLDGGAFWSSGEGETGKNLDLFILRFGGKADPSFIAQWFLPAQIGSWNWQRWDSQDYAKFFQEAATSGDARHRADCYIRMQQLMNQSDAIVPLTHETNIYVTTQKLDPAILPNGDDIQYPAFRLV
jgi:peptide/nickel transport system substrate-binding protein